MRSTQNPETNIEIVTDIMEFSKHGPLIQGFVMVALDAYAAQVIKHGAKTFDSPLINGEAWVGCAQEVIDKIRNRA